MWQNSFITQKCIKRLTATVRSAIRIHSKTGDIQKLRHDLRNGPYHIFRDIINHFAKW